MKILMVTDSFYPESIGGSENVLYNTSRNLVNKGNEVVILVGARSKRTKNLGQYEDMEGIKVYRYPDYYRTFGVFYISSILNCIRAFKKVSADFKFDIIHFHHALTSFAVNLSKCSRDIKKIYHFHGPSNKEFEADLVYRKREFNFFKKFFVPIWSKLKSELLKFMEHYSLKRSDRVITLSNYMKGNLINIHKYFHENSDKVEIIPGGIDMDKFYPSTFSDKIETRKKLNLPTDKNIVLTIRRLTARMGVDNLILAFDDIIKLNKNFHLVIVGDGDMRKYLEYLANKLGIQNFTSFVGSISNDMLLPYYQSADLFILPSVTLEGFGLVILEALASGVPVIAAKTGGGSAEIIEKFKKEFLISDASPKTISNTIIEFFESKKDISELSSECRKFVSDNFNWDISTDEIIKLYNEVLK